LALSWFAAPASAGDGPNAPLAKSDKKDDSSKESLAETTHVVSVGGAKLEYKATAGRLPLKDDEGKTTADVFFIAYTKTGVDDLAHRPITFAFNGGPGSSSVWLHLGAFGPKRVVLGDEGEAPPPPYRLVDNEDTLLDLTDLVFIDPVSTGYSRSPDPKEEKQFHGVEEDVHSVGDFIRLYVTRFNRWESPKFLAGESYGTTRAAGLAGYLQDRHGIYLNGIVLVSAVLNFETLRFTDGNDLPYILYLPSYSATAWYHKKLSPDLQADLSKTLAEASKFAVGDYAAALMKGDALPDDQRREIEHKLARYTGLSDQFVERSNLRVDQSRFCKELLRDEHRIAGRYDSRITGADADAASDRPGYDPSYTAVQGAFTAAFNEYVRNDLKYDNDAPYEILTGKVQPWDYGDAKNRYLNVAPTLQKAMTQNRDLHVFVANGRFDLATPFLATEYTFNHLGLEPALRGHVTMGYYEAGHMVYTRPSEHQKLKKDLAAFYRSAMVR
jgi:carboxypeptidase C (cathepsin A)